MNYVRSTEVFWHCSLIDFLPKRSSDFFVFTRKPRFGTKNDRNYYVDIFVVREFLGVIENHQMSVWLRFWIVYESGELFPALGHASQLLDRNRCLCGIGVALERREKKGDVAAAAWAGERCPKTNRRRQGWNEMADPNDSNQIINRKSSIASVGRLRNQNIPKTCQKYFRIIRGGHFVPLWYPALLKKPPPPENWLAHQHLRAHPNSLTKPQKQKQLISKKTASSFAMRWDEGQGVSFGGSEKEVRVWSRVRVCTHAQAHRSTLLQYPWKHGVQNTCPQPASHGHVTSQMQMGHTSLCLRDKDCWGAVYSLLILWFIICLPINWFRAGFDTGKKYFIYRFLFALLSLQKWLLQKYLICLIRHKGKRKAKCGGTFFKIVRRSPVMHTVKKNP